MQALGKAIACHHGNSEVRITTGERQGFAAYLRNVSEGRSGLDRDRETLG